MLESPQMSPSRPPHPAVTEHFKLFYWKVGIKGQQGAQTNTYTCQAPLTLDNKVNGDSTRLQCLSRGKGIVHTNGEYDQFIQCISLNNHAHNDIGQVIDFLMTIT